MDYYSVLGIDKAASQADIKSAYRRKAKEFHPDSGASPDEKKFSEATEAYKVLSNPESKSKYDTYGHADFRNASVGFEVNFSDIGDIFASMFGGTQRGRGHRQVQRGRDIKELIQITLDEAAAGIEKQIKNQYFVYCDSCSGVGGATATCENCKGVGRTTQHIGNTMIQSTCRSCGGHGKVITSPCDKCQSSGSRYAYENLSIKIPPGVRHGHEFRVQGHGCHDHESAPRGDLWLVVEILPHDQFIRQDDDLLMETNVSIIDACLGKVISVKSIYGEQIDIQIPAGIQPGDTVKVPYQGMPSIGRKGKGSLYLVVNICVPQKISDKGKKILQELKKELV